jgi:tartrate dehydratase alpha subunit/fumarate hydratase class I-like protein
MIREFSTDLLRDAICRMCGTAAFDMPKDVTHSIEEALAAEDFPNARSVLQELLEN